MEYLICVPFHFNWSALTPIVAIIVSIIALFINRAIAQRNTRLTIQQALFKTITDKVKDCNTLWETEPENERHPNSPHFKVMSELIISIEIIDKSLSLFQKNYKSIRREFESDYYYLFWKQLRTDLRDWVKTTPEIAKVQNDDNYKLQVADLFKKFQRHFEKMT